MKRIYLTLILATVLCVAGNSVQANAGPVGTLEASIGYVKSSTEVGTTDQSLGGGIGFGAAYWRSASPTLSWGAEVSYDNMGKLEVEGDDPFVGFYTEELSANVLRVNPAVRMNFGSMVGPNFFAQAGAGLYNISADYKYEDSFEVFEAEDSESKFGFNIGAGVGFPVGPSTRMNISGTYHLVSGNEGAVMENFNQLQFRAGIGFGL